MQTKIKLPTLLAGLVVGCATTTVFALHLPSGPSMPTKDIIEIKKGVEYIQQQLSGVDRIAKANLVACGIYNGKVVNYYNDPNGLGTLQLAGLQTESDKKKWCYNGSIEDPTGVLDVVHNKINRNKLDEILSTHKKFSWNCVFKAGVKLLKVTCSIYRNSLYNRDETTFASYDGQIRAENDSVITHVVSKFSEDRWYGVWHDYDLLKHFTNGWIKFYKDGLKNYKHTGLIKGRIGFQTDISSLDSQEQWLKEKIAETSANIAKQNSIVARLKDKIYYNNKSISSFTKKISELDKKKKQLDSYEIVTIPIKLHVIQKNKWARVPVIASYSPGAYVLKTDIDTNYYTHLPEKLIFYKQQISALNNKLNQLEKRQLSLYKRRVILYHKYTELVNKMFYTYYGIHVGWALNRLYEPKNSAYFYRYKRHHSAVRRARAEHTIIYGKKHGWYHHRKRFVFNKDGFALYNEITNLEKQIIQLDSSIGSDNIPSIKHTISYYKQRLSNAQAELATYKKFISSSDSYKNILKKKYNVQITSYKKAVDTYKRANVNINNQIESVNLLIAKIYKSRKQLETKLSQLIRLSDKVTQPITVRIKVNGVCNPSYNNKNLKGLVFGDYLCSAGKFINARKKGSLYTWTCQGFNGGISVQCKAAAAIPRCDLNHANEDTYRIVNGKVDKCVLSRKTFTKLAVYENFYGRLSDFCQHYMPWSNATSRRYYIAAEFWNWRDHRKVFGPIYNSDLNNYLVRGYRGGKYRARAWHLENGHWRQIYYDSWSKETRHRHGVLCIADRVAAHWQTDAPRYY